jgi:membrane fusion protein, copper/silver efflux system
MSSNETAASPVDLVPDPSPAGRWGAFGMIVKAVQVRLRFIIVLALAFLVVGRWETLRNTWERLTRGAIGGNERSAISTDTEYFCPMDPGVLSDWPGKCGICNMGLVRRKKGEAVMLPNGVVSRMQISPYQLQLAGIRTSPAEYQPLTRPIVFPGTLQGVDRESNWSADVELSGRAAAVSVSDPVELTCDALPDHALFPAKVQKLSKAEEGQGYRMVLHIDDPGQTLRPGFGVTVRFQRPVADDEPFCSLPSKVPPLRSGEPRAFYLCAEHPDVFQDAAGKCPIDGKAALEPTPLLNNQRLGWWCPMHSKVTADQTGARCAECGGMKLVPRIVTYRPPGQVLTVPESAVVDTGSRALVYVERMPGMFDGVEVVLGPRCGERYPVVSGLEPGQRVAAAGTFLIDAETRLNPSLAASYFGAARGSRESTAIIPEPPSDVATLATAQKVCPVTGKLLGLMGTPRKVVVKGRTVLICCEGCREALESAPEKYLSKVSDAETMP